MGSEESVAQCFEKGWLYLACAIIAASMLPDKDFKLCMYVCDKQDPHSIHSNKELCADYKKHPSKEADLELNSVQS